MGFPQHHQSAARDGRKPANVEEETVAAEAAGIRYVHLPFGGPDFDPRRGGTAFLEAIVETRYGTRVHSLRGRRDAPASMWFIKRVMLDEWGRRKPRWPKRRTWV